MPTNLPDDFNGTGKPPKAHWVDVDAEPKRDDERPPRWFYTFMTIVTILGLWTLAHAVIAVVHALFRLT